MAQQTDLMHCVNGLQPASDSPQAAEERVKNWQVSQMEKRRTTWTIPRGDFGIDRRESIFSCSELSPTHDSRFVTRSSNEAELAREDIPPASSRHRYPKIWRNDGNLLDLQFSGPAVELVVTDAWHPAFDYNKASKSQRGAQGPVRVTCNGNKDYGTCHVVYHKNRKGGDHLEARKWQRDQDGNLCRPAETGLARETLDETPE